MKIKSESNKTEFEIVDIIEKDYRLYVRLKYDSDIFTDISATDLLNSINKSDWKIIIDDTEDNTPRNI